ncbi:uncharacterized protein LOC141904506 [Tubulanus polymorphus]|uniref:uncharacterized protein LOC141904506 n=1 Tax=Tubulanus polymorphus TaxID=672921 RepID=UPI003DA3595C
MASDEDEDLKALRLAVLASMKNKTSSSDKSDELETDDLEALRAAALQTRKKDIIIQPPPPRTFIPQTTVFSEQPGNLQIGHGRYHRDNRGAPGNWNSRPAFQRTKNLIVIPTDPDSTSSSSSFDRKSITSDKNILLRPQDRWADSNTSSPCLSPKTKVSDKFRRFESSGSESEESSSDSGDDSDGKDESSDLETSVVSDHNVEITDTDEIRAGVAHEISLLEQNVSLLDDDLINLTEVAEEADTRRFVICNDGASGNNPAKPSADSRSSVVGSYIVEKRDDSPDKRIANPAPIHIKRDDNHEIRREKPTENVVASDKSETADLDRTTDSADRAQVIKKPTIIHIERTVTKSQKKDSAAIRDTEKHTTRSIDTSSRNLMAKNASKSDLEKIPLPLEKPSAVVKKDVKVSKSVNQDSSKVGLKSNEKATVSEHDIDANKTKCNETVIDAGDWEKMSDVDKLSLRLRGKAKSVTKSNDGKLESDLGEKKSVEKISASVEKPVKSADNVVKERKISDSEKVNTGRNTDDSSKKKSSDNETLSSSRNADNSSKKKSKDIEKSSSKQSRISPDRKTKKSKREKKPEKQHHKQGKSSDRQIPELEKTKDSKTDGKDSSVKTKEVNNDKTESKKSSEKSSSRVHDRSPTPQKTPDKYSKSASSGGKSRGRRSNSRENTPRHHKKPRTRTNSSSDDSSSERESSRRKNSRKRDNEKTKTRRSKSRSRSRSESQSTRETGKKTTGSNKSKHSKNREHKTVGDSAKKVTRDNSKYVKKTDISNKNRSSSKIAVKKKSEWDSSSSDDDEKTDKKNVSLISDESDSDDEKATWRFKHTGKHAKETDEKIFERDRAELEVARKKRDGNYEKVDRGLTTSYRRDDHRRRDRYDDRDSSYSRSKPVRHQRARRSPSPHQRARRSPSPHQRARRSPSPRRRRDKDDVDSDDDRDSRKRKSAVVKSGSDASKSHDAADDRTSRSQLSNDRKRPKEREPSDLDPINEQTSPQKKPKMNPSETDSVQKDRASVHKRLGSSISASTVLETIEREQPKASLAVDDKELEMRIQKIKEKNAAILQRKKEIDEDRKLYG